MTPPVFWVKTSTAWHAWIRGASHAVCGRITSAMLQQGQCDVRQAVTTADTICRTCTNKLGVVIPPAPSAPKGVAGQWQGFIQRHLRLVGLRAQAGDVEALAALLAEQGPPAGDNETWQAVRDLLLAPHYVKDATGRRRATLLGLHNAVAALQAPGALPRVTRALQAWRATTGRTVTHDRCNSGQVVQVMLLVPDVAPYVQHLKGRGLEHLAAVFHPNTFERAKRDANLRGLFASSGAYWDANQDRIRVVTD